MIGKPWRKMDTRGGYVAYDVHKIYLMNLGLTTLEDLQDIGLFPLVSLHSTQSLFNPFARCAVFVTCVCSTNVQKQK